jgi:hypothetical protein
MKTFSTKMQEVLNLKDTYPAEIITPGKTDKKVVRGQEPEPNPEYRSHVGILNWLSMGIRYDIVYTTKELSRVLNEPTKVASDIVRRALLYITRTKEAHLSFSHTAMMTFKVPATRKKPTDMKDNYETQDYRWHHTRRRQDKRRRV